MASFALETLMFVKCPMEICPTIIGSSVPSWTVLALAIKILEVSLNLVLHALLVLGAVRSLSITLYGGPRAGGTGLPILLIAQLPQIFISNR